MSCLFGMDTVMVCTEIVIVDVLLIIIIKPHSLL